MLFSVVLAVYVGIQSLAGAKLGLDNIINCGVMIGSPLIIGAVLIIVSIPEEKKRKVVLFTAYVTLFLYGIIVFALVFGGFRIERFGYRNNQTLIAYIKLNSNFVPFKTIFYYVICFFTGEINRSIAIENLVGNFMMFMPTGLLFPAIFSRQKKWFYFLITITSILIGIEIIQLAFRLGTFDVDDFILNMAGACLTYGILRIGVIKIFLNKTKIII